MKEEELLIQLPKLQSRIPYDEDIFENTVNWNIVLKGLLEDSKSIMLETLFPFDDFDEMSIPKNFYNWQLRCCVELYNLADKQGISNYSETGFSWSKLSDGLSVSLMNKLNSHVGVPKKKEKEETD